MNGQWIDLGIILIIGLSVLTGLFRGFIKEVVALLSWILAIWLGIHYSPSLDPWLAKYLSDQTMRAAAGFILVFFATLLAGGIVNAILSFILKRAGLSGTDRTLGMGFGFLRGVFIVALIMVAIKMTSLPYQNYAKESKLYARFDPVVDFLSGLMPDFINKMKMVDNQDKSAEFEFQAEA